MTEFYTQIGNVPSWMNKSNRKAKQNRTFNRYCSKHFIYYPVTEKGCEKCLEGGEK